MNNILNKFLKFSSLVIVLTFLFSFCFTSSIVNAQSNTDEGILLSQKIVSEYDMYKEFKISSDEQLLKKGYTKEEITSMRNTNYVDELKRNVEKRAKLDNNTLQKMGYTNEQIEVIRNFTGTEDQIYALSASLALSTYFGASSKSSTYSQANFRTDWTWSSIPVWTETDIIAAAWSEGMYLETGSSYTYATYDFYDEFTDVYLSTATTPVIANLNTGAYIKFDIGYHNSDIGGQYAKKGQFGYKISKQSLVEELAVLAKYGHSQVIVQPTVYIGYPPTVSIGFSWGVNEEASNSRYVDL